MNLQKKDLMFLGVRKHSCSSFALSDERIGLDWSFGWFVMI